MATHIVHEEVRATRFECRSGAVLVETLHDFGITLNDLTVRGAIELINSQTTAIVVKMNGPMSDPAHSRMMNGVVMFYEVAGTLLGISTFRSPRNGGSK